MYVKSKQMIATTNLQLKCWTLVFLGVGVIFSGISFGESTDVQTAAKSDNAATIDNPVNCKNGKSIDGTSGIEKYLKPDMVCKMFPIFTWKYPPVGGLDGQTGGVETPTCGKAAQQLINDLACTIKGHSLFQPFAARSSDAASKIEIAAFLAHVYKETGGLGTILENAASDYCEERKEFPCVPGKKYCGRGYHQISYNYNYGALSNFWYNESDGATLLNDPDRLVNDLELAWGGALWFWFSNRDHNDGQCQGRTDQVGKSLFEGYGFGNGISIINGGIECAAGNEPKNAIYRVQYFLYMLGIIDEKLLPPNLMSSDFKVIPDWLTEGCPLINLSYKVKCHVIKDKLENREAMPSGWNSGWTGVVSRFICKSEKNSEDRCGKEKSGGKPSDMSQWPWQYLGGQQGNAVDVCSSNPCGNGTCIKNSNSYSCNCLSGYHYDQTTCVPDAIDPCSPNPCGNGTCSKNGNAHKCSCPHGQSYNGITCVPSQITGEDCKELKVCYSKCVENV